MITSYGSRVLRLLSLVLSLAAALVFFPRAALAGSFHVTQSEVQEKDGQWTVKLKVSLSKAPGMSDVPMRFTFTKTVVYERTVMEKGKDPVLNRISLGTSPTNIVSMDVHFGDARGKIHTTASFDFPVSREEGFFEAGEYQLAVNGPEGFGSSQRLILKGDNPVVFRGAMDFGDNKDTKTDKKAKAVDDTPDTASVGAEVQASGKAAPMIPESAGEKTEEEEGVHSRPKGCGCSVPGGSTGSFAFLPVGFLVAAILARRKFGKFSAIA